MKFHIAKSSVMWFGVCGRECAADVAAVFLDGVSLKAVTQQKYLGGLLITNLHGNFRLPKFASKWLTICV